MCFPVIEQLAGTNKARGCNYNKGNPEKDEREPVVKAKRPEQAFELQSMFRIKRVRICHREHKQVELLNDDPAVEVEHAVMPARGRPTPRLHSGARAAR